MPKAVSNTASTFRKDLSSLPAVNDEEGGFIVVRRLTYGEKLERRAMVSRMQIGGNSKSKDFAGEMQLVNEEATLFDFKKCIVDHNLQDEDGRKLDFTKLEDVRKLDPIVGEEIDNYLGDLNNFEDDEGN